MAVAGRKISDFTSSENGGSADKLCDPCQNDGNNVEAHGFCVDCQEYLCGNCFSCHRKTKASRHHVMLDKDQMVTDEITIKSLEDSVKKCPTHKNEEIKFFCPKHYALGCHDCIILHHRACDIDYIQEKSKDIGNSTEYAETLKKVEEEIRNTEIIVEMGGEKDREIDSSHDRTCKDIALFRKEMNEWIDAVQVDADNKKSKVKQNIKTLLASCANISSNLKHTKEKLKDAKEKDDHVQLFIRLKLAQIGLKKNEMKEVKESIEKADTKFTFERTRDLENLLSNPDVSFGKITSLKRNKTFTSLQLKEKICVKSTTDNYECDITSCKLLPSDRLLIADFLNKNVKIVYLNKHAVTEGVKFQSSPRDIALLPNDEIAVTLQNENKIVIVTMSGDMTVKQTISVKASCRGIFYHQHHVHSVCQSPICVVDLDMQSNDQDTIMLTDENMKAPNYIVPHQDCKKFYISNFSSHTVTSVTPDGMVCAVYKDWVLRKPLGMAVLDDGSLLVCCSNGNVHHINEDLKNGRQLAEQLGMLRSVCYNRDKHEVYIGGKTDQLKVFTFQ